MTAGVIDTGCWRLLTVSAAAVGAARVVFSAVPFVASWRPHHYVNDTLIEVVTDPKGTA